MLIAGCSATESQPQPVSVRPVPTLFPTVAVVAPPSTPPPDAPTPTPETDSGWMIGERGIATRHIRQPGTPSNTLLIARIDLAAVRLRVVYDPQQPRAIRRWFDEQRPLLAVNGGFFTEQYQSTALVISDGIASGASYEGFGGMLAVAEDGSVSLRALRDQPYDRNEPLVQAMQSFPMLVFPGGAPSDFQDDGRRARRTVVAFDRAGRLLVIVSPTSGLTLRDLADWLLQSDLEIDRALNFDGGPSTGLFIGAGMLSEQIDSLGPLPLVLLVEPGD